MRRYDSPLHISLAILLIVSAISLVAVFFEILLLVLVVAVPISVVLAAGSTIYLARLYGNRGGTARSWVWEAMLVVCAVAVSMGVGIGGLAALRIANILGIIDFSLPNRVTSPPVAAAIVAILSAPTYYAARIAWIRRARGDYTPPPVREGD